MRVYFLKYDSTKLNVMITYDLIVSTPAVSTYSRCRVHSGSPMSLAAIRSHVQRIPASRRRPRTSAVGACARASPHKVNIFYEAHIKLPGKFEERSNDKKHALISHSGLVYTIFMSVSRVFRAASLSHTRHSLALAHSSSRVSARRYPLPGARRRPRHGDRGSPKYYNT